MRACEQAHASTQAGKMHRQGPQKPDRRSACPALGDSRRVTSHRECERTRLRAAAGAAAPFPPAGTLCMRVQLMPAAPQALRQSGGTLQGLLQTAAMQPVCKWRTGNVFIGPHALLGGLGGLALSLDGLPTGSLALGRAEQAGGGKVLLRAPLVGGGHVLRKQFVAHVALGLMRMWQLVGARAGQQTS